MLRSLTMLLAGALLIPQAASADDFLRGGDLLDVFFNLKESITQFKKPNLKFGKLEFHPYYRVTASYDDNIYLRSQDSQQVFGSMIIDNSFGVSLKLPATSRHQFQGGYAGQSLAYSKHPSRNNTVQQNVNLGYGFKGPAGFSLKAQDTYVNTQDPASSELVDREQRYQNSAGGVIEYAPGGGAFYIAADGEHLVHRYQNESLAAALDRYELAVGGRMGLRIMTKTRVFAGYKRQIVHYTIDEYAAGGNTYDAKNNKADLLVAGIEGRILPKVQGSIETGVVHRTYDGPETDRAEITARRTGSTRNWVIMGQSQWKPGARTDVNLRLSRGLQESTYAGNRFYIANLAALSIKHKLPYKLVIALGGAIGFDQYPEAVSDTEANRRDDIYTQFASLTYDIQDYLSVGLSYSHKEKHSTQSAQFNYLDNVSGAFVGVTF